MLFYAFALATLFAGLPGFWMAGRLLPRDLPTGRVTEASESRRPDQRSYLAVLKS
jgi:hypothetical protein